MYRKGWFAPRPDLLLNMVPVRLVVAHKNQGLVTADRSSQLTVQGFNGVEAGLPVGLLVGPHQYGCGLALPLGWKKI
jgi:hypothetical protein